MSKSILAAIVASTLLGLLSASAQDVKEDSLSVFSRRT